MFDSLQVGFDWCHSYCRSLILKTIWLNFKDNQIVFKIKDLNNSVTMNYFLFK